MKISEREWNKIKAETLSMMVVTEEHEGENGYELTIIGYDNCDRSKVEIFENVFPNQCKDGTYWVAWIAEQYCTEEMRYEIFTSDEDFWANAED